MALNVPAALGLKTRVTGVLWPARIATGRLGALSEKYGVENVALVTVMEAVPVFVKVVDKVLLVPAVTVPKSTVVPLRVKMPVSACWLLELLVLTPWQPTIIAKPSRTIPSLLTLLAFTAAVVRKHFIGLSQAGDSAKSFLFDFAGTH